LQKKIVSKILIPIAVPKLDPVLNPVPILEQDPNPDPVLVQLLLTGTRTGGLNWPN
jgi:hypothetical protein